MVAPWSSGEKYTAFISTRSMTPMKSLPLPIGSWIAMPLAPRRERIDAKEKSQSAPILSILLMKQRRGTP